MSDTFHLYIATDHDAFQMPTPSAEVARILRALSRRLEAGEDFTTPQTLHDINGNNAGRAWFHDDKPDTTTHVPQSLITPATAMSHGQRIKQPNCPTCGLGAVHLVQKIEAWRMFDRPTPADDFDFSDDYMTGDDDGDPFMQVLPGPVELTCENNHDWQTLILAKDDPDED